MFKKSNVADKEKEKWMKAFVPELVSSEESNSDEDVIMVRPLQWRSEKVTSMFYRLDEKIESSKTTQAKRQKRRRVLGTECSARPQPPGVPKWTVAA